MGGKELWPGVFGCLTGEQQGSNTILSSFVGALSPSRQGSPSHNARADSYKQWRGSPEGSQALHTAVWESPAPAWNFTVAGTEGLHGAHPVPTEAVTKTWQDTLLNCTRHHFSHLQKTSARLSALSWLTLQASLQKGIRRTALAFLTEVRRDGEEGQCF